MKKFFYLFTAGLFILRPATSSAQEQGTLRDMLISEELVVQDRAGNAKTEAGRLLDSTPKKIEIKGVKFQPVRRPPKEKGERDKILEKYGEAPFGLVWGASTTYTKDTGVALGTPIEQLNQKMYPATLLPKPLDNFEQVYLSFGRDNKLWRIIAYSRGLEDNAKANAGLREYNKYARLLEQKYGNRKEEFVPKITEIQETKKLPNSDTEIITKKIESKIGGDNFLEELQSGETALLSTFSDGKLGIFLSIEVDKDGKSYIVIDYKNLQLIKEQEDATFNSI